jgi:N-carbamoylputrescine amidase
MDMDAVREIRNLWQFFRDRRPEIYGDLTALQ